ncbi:MAG: SIMPL domain-containing protein [Betaproteobacteria bacterium]
MTRNPMPFRLTIAAALLAAAGAAQTAELPPPAGVLGLSASASTEVANDVLGVTLATTRDGLDAQTVQTAMKRALDAALAEARRAARPDGQLEVRTGNFSLFPRYSNKGQIAGWQGSAELLIEGKDMAGIAQLVGRLNALPEALTISRVAYRLSRQQREKVESEVTAQAIERYRARAAEMAREFGYASYTIREVTVSGNEPPPYGPVAMMRAKPAGAADEALPIEPGKGTVTVTVSGTVQMAK